MSPPAGTGSAERLREQRVRDVMTGDLVTCAADVPLGEAAELMVGHRIHSVVVLPTSDPDEDDDPAGWGVLSDLDLVAAAPWDADEMTVGTVAASPRAVVPADASLADAARSMAEYASAHLLVVEPQAARPVGIISALDIARALAPPPPAPPRPAPPSRRARPGDRLVIAPHYQGERGRDAEVLEARGEDGGPPFLVRWDDTGRVSLHYPGPDCRIDRPAPG